MMDGKANEAAGIWPRACTFLARQALEDALAELWDVAAPGVERASKRSQLTCLSSYIDAEAAARATHTWHALSMFCHDHACVLQPVLSEVSSWIDEVQALMDAIDRQVDATTCCQVN